MVSTDIRERLLVTAITLAREQGLPKLTQSRVAKAAGVSWSHLTYYFPTRSDLVHTVLEQGAERQCAV
jgi:AcrR family transcriptional regulator